MSFPETVGKRGFVICIALALALTVPATGQVSPGDDERLADIRRLLDSGDYARAETDAANLRTSLMQSPSTPAGDLFSVTDLLVEALCRNGKGAQASTLALATDVLQGRTAKVGPDNPSLIPSLRNLSLAFVQGGRYAAAVDPARRALAIREKSDGNTGGAADELDDLAVALTWAESWDEGLTTAERALHIRDQSPGEGNLALARSLEIDGLILQRQGQHARARAAFERAVEIRESSSSSTPDMAASLSLLSEQLWFVGDLREAQQHGERALMLAEQSLRVGHPDIAVHLRRLALPVYDLGDALRARALRERAVAIAQAAYGPDHPAVALQLNDLANSLTHQADYLGARALFERALKIFEHVKPDSAGAIAAGYNLAVVDSRLGDYVAAETNYKQIISAWTRVRGPENQYVAYGLFALADLCENEGRLDEARSLYEQSLHMRQAALGDGSVDVARTLTSLARVLLASGEVEVAQERSSAAIRIWMQSGAQEDGYADALSVHASIQAKRGDRIEATASYRQALSILEKVHGPRHLYVSNGMMALAVSLATQGNFREAMNSAFEAQEIARDHLSVTVRYLSERQALGYVARRLDGLDVALSVLDQDEKSAPSRLFDLLVRSRSLTLDEMASRHAVIADVSTAGVAELRRELMAARQRLANLVVRGAGQRPDQYRGLVESTTRDKEALERRLAEKSAIFREEQKESAIGAADVQAALPPRTALLSFYRYERALFDTSPSQAAAPRTNYLAFIVRTGSSNPTIVRLGSADQIDELVSRWRSEFTGGVLARGPMASEKRLRQAGTRLRELVWDPVAREIDGVERVLIVPDGSLNLVPFAALPSSESAYLLQSGPAIHYLSAERDLVRPERSTGLGQGLLVLGAPAFEDTVVRSTARKVTRNQQDAVFRGPIADCATFQVLNFGGLPSSGREANDVARMWKTFGPGAGTLWRGPQLLLGRAADEASFKSMSPGHRVIHLATHGFFLGGDCSTSSMETRSVGGLAPRKKPNAAGDRATPNALSQRAAPPSPAVNPLLLSGLALAGANRRAKATADEEDGILTAEEVASLDLSGVEWAVLSACDTGLGEIKAGEGVFGLRRAFQIAGAHTVIMSLWSVEDRAAMTWMRALYEGRLARKLDTATAVREASLSVLKDRRARGLSTHPFYWAGFVASGDWR